ncbi:MAG: YceI family protein [Ferruginibacter sp.]|nr:YceI family protein [Ferruginibacter sp.]
MKRSFFTIAALFILATVFAFTLPTAWKIAEKYSISFSTSGVSGIFKTFTGNIIFDEQSLATSKFDITIDINSINTGNGMQNKHAKGEEWFNALKYPAIKFTSKKIIKTGVGYNAIGDLQLRGITKETSLPFQFKRNSNGGIFEGAFNVNRNDFKIGTPGGEVGETIKINVSVPVKK